MKKNYMKPAVAVYEMCLEQLLAASPKDITVDPNKKGQGNNFWQAPVVNRIIDDELDEEFLLEELGEE